MEKKYPHEGHRKRLRDRYMETGFDGFAPHEVLELVLQAAIPRQDTKKIAYELIDTFGNINNVFNASVEELAACKGIGEGSAVWLHLITDTVRYCDKQKIKKIKTLRTSTDFGEYAVPLLSHLPDETFYAIALDASCNIVRCENMGKGNSAEVLVNIRQLATLAIKNNASAVVLAHNHPSGILEASYEDIEFTQKVKSILSALGIMLLDHIIVSDGDYISFGSKGFI